MTACPSKVAIEIQARPDCRTLETIDPTSGEPDGGWMHNTANCDSLTTVQPNDRNEWARLAANSTECSTCSP